MKKINCILISILAVASLSGCDKYLSEKPSKSTSLQPTTVDQLDYLFNAYSAFYEEKSKYQFISSDAFDLNTKLTDVDPTQPGLEIVQYACWDVDNLAQATDYFFSGEYSKIFTANMVLSNLSKVTGSDEKKAQLEKEAHFIRAYSTWMLAQTYCLPYTDATKDELGLTIKASTSFEEATKRATLKETYDFIEADLEIALGITNDMTVVNNKYTSWRANKAAVNGFAARYWLNRGDYDKAYQYAKTALESHGDLVNYNTEMHYSTNPSYATINGNQQVEILYPYTHDNQIDMTDMMEWKELMYFRMANYDWWWYIPSPQLLGLYDKQYDLRYKYHIVENYSYDRGLTNPAFEYPGYIFFFKDRIPSGPTTAEMLLIEAECLARQNKVSDAMAVVNKLRAVRMDSSAPDNVRFLSAASKDEAIKKIIDEREREMPFTERWYDIRRLNNNDDPNDDVGDLTRTYYPYNSATVLTGEAPITYTLAKNSRRYAAPITNSDISASNGVIEQNKY
jgi:tetratricopeptide (TPR) repeat protein